MTRTRCCTQHQPPPYPPPTFPSSLGRKREREASTRSLFFFLGVCMGKLGAMVARSIMVKGQGRMWSISMARGRCIESGLVRGALGWRNKRRTVEEENRVPAVTRPRPWPLIGRWDHTRCSDDRLVMYMGVGMARGRRTLEHSAVASEPSAPKNRVSDTTRRGG